MGLPALKIELEVPVEERVARLEANVEHIQSDISEMKTDVRRLDTKIDCVKDSIFVLSLQTERSFLKLEKSISSAKLWAFGLYIALAAGLLCVLARGFKWI